jgi:hypothetical protein
LYRGGHSGAPSESEPCLIVLGTELIASSEIVIIVGSAIIPRIMEPVKAVCPVGRLKTSLISGTSTTSPKNPNTTEGMPARISIKGFRKSATLGCASSEIYIAQAIPRGIEKIIAPAVTIREPKSRGNKPNCMFKDVGYQDFPVRKPRRDVSLKRSKLSLNKKRHIRKSIMTVRALTENSTHSIDFSLYFLLGIFFP